MYKLLINMAGRLDPFDLLFFLDFVYSKFGDKKMQIMWIELKNE